MVDPCVDRREVDETKVFVLVWAYDIILAASDNEIMNKTKMRLQERCKTKDLGRSLYFLSIEFQQGDSCVQMYKKKHLS